MANTMERAPVPVGGWSAYSLPDTHRRRPSQEPRCRAEIDTLRAPRVPNGDAPGSPSNGVRPSGQPSERRDGAESGVAERPDRSFDVRAACADYAELDFFPDLGKPKVVAACLAVCESCPVRQPCLDAAILEERDLQDNYLAGIRGGMTSEQRRMARTATPSAPTGARQRPGPHRRGVGRNTDQRVLAVLEAADRPLTDVEVHERVTADAGPGEGLLKLSSIMNSLRNGRKHGVTSTPRGNTGPTEINRSGPGTARLYSLGIPVGRTVYERVLEVLTTSLVALDRRQIHGRVNDEALPDETAVPIKTIQHALQRGMLADVTREGTGKFGYDEFRYRLATAEAVA